MVDAVVDAKRVLEGIMSQSGNPPPPKPPSPGQQGTGRDNGGMEDRVAKLEEFTHDARDRLTRIETRLDQTATKSDLHEAMNGMVKWMVGTAVGLGVAGITVMTFVLNNAAPKAPPATPAPIVITIPAPTPGK